MMKTIHKFKWASLILILFFLGVLLFQNSGETTLQVLWMQVEVSRMLLILGVGLAGFLAGVISVLLFQRRDQ